MDCLVLKKDVENPNFVHLCLKSTASDASEASYVTIFRMMLAQACAICGPHTGISAEFPIRGFFADIAPKSLSIEKRPDRLPMTLPWQVRIGDYVVHLPGEDGPELLDDEDVRCLMDHGIIEFEPGQPDWKLRGVEDAEDAAWEMRHLAEAAEEHARACREEYDAGKLPAPEM